MPSRASGRATYRRWSRRRRTPPLVVLADARTCTEPGRPLTVVDLYDTPGQSTVLPCREVGSMACNLEISNMDFHEFVAVEAVEP
ncbi:hypothetical protein AB0B40_37410 [Streptomyces sp. NPDC042638]|uniref:DUF6924 domain-containing protein n=1 Tax=Streptomyces sp. NPDC042638 TaxID=3154333 RepID=UPI0033F1AEC4